MKLKALFEVAIKLLSLKNDNHSSTIFPMQLLKLSVDITFSIPTLIPVYWHRLFRKQLEIKI